jgi:hypothetical protein
MYSARDASTTSRPGRLGLGPHALAVRGGLRAERRGAP